MKKTIVLLTIVLALIAAPVFAETGFAGSVEFKYGTDFDGFATDTGNDTTISLDGSVGEFSSISVGIEADGDSAATATLMTLSQDVTGALGIDGPVSFAYKMGKQTYSPADYSGVAGYEDAGIDAKIGQKWTGSLADGDTEFSTDSRLGTVLTFGFADMIMLDAVVYPQSYFEEADSIWGVVDTYTEFGVNLYGTFGPAQVSAYFVGSPYTNMIEDIADLDSDAIDENGKMVGANAGITVDALKIGIVWETKLNNDYVNAGLEDETPMTTSIGAAAQYSIGPVTPGLALKTGMTEDVDFDFAADTGYGLNVTFAAAEALNLTAAIGGAFDFDAVVYEVGVDYALDGITYALGYTKGSEFAGYDAEFTNDDGDAVGNMYVKVKASF
jgi:hypothetical protein